MSRTVAKTTRLVLIRRMPIVLSPTCAIDPPPRSLPGRKSGWPRPGACADARWAPCRISLHASRDTLHPTRGRLARTASPPQLPSAHRKKQNEFCETNPKNRDNNPKNADLPQKTNPIKPTSDRQRMRVPRPLWGLGTDSCPMPPCRERRNSIFPNKPISSQYHHTRTNTSSFSLHPSSFRVAPPCRSRCAELSRVTEPNVAIESVELIVTKLGPGRPPDDLPPTMRQNGDRSMLNTMSGWMKGIVFAAGGLLLSAADLSAGEDDVKSSTAAATFHDFSVKDIDGQDVKLSTYRGEVCLVVNVASK